MICCVCGKEIVINHGSVEMNGVYCDKCIKYVEKQKITDCAYTDEQIISALEIRMPHDAICREALDLIKRQRAEIERLKKYYFTHDYHECHNEAIKEFAESMKKREGSNAYCCFCAHATIYGDRAKECDEPYIDKDGKEHSHCLMFSKFESYIDKLVKEMTEDKQ